MMGREVKTARKTALDGRRRWRIRREGLRSLAARRLGGCRVPVLTFCRGRRAPDSVGVRAIRFRQDRRLARRPIPERPRGSGADDRAERARLASIEELFKSELEASGQYRFAPIAADPAAKIGAGPQIGACGACEFDYGEQLGGDFAAWIVVQKVSDLILNINAYMVDVAARKLTFVHSVDIRGNTDKSWTRGLTYLVKNYLLASQL